jgi:hypothetical protein
VYDSGDGDYFVECSIVDNFMTRTAPRKKWLGDDESWEKSKKEEKERDENIRCPTCEFIKKLKIESEEKTHSSKSHNNILNKVKLVTT